MQTIDTHVHLEGDPAQWDPMMIRSAAAGVAAWVVVGGSEAMNASAREAAARWPGKAFAAVGFDRHAADTGMPDAAARLVALLDDADGSGAGVVAIGEIGLDHHFAPRNDQAQQRVMDEQLAVARQRRLPVVVHSRDADEETIATLEAHRSGWKGEPDRIGVIHSFTGDTRFALAVIELGFHVSFSGILTFRNADDLRRVAVSVPATRLLVETDTPYLAPVPVRGRPNEPAYVLHVVRALALARGESAEAVAQQTTLNARRLFLGM